MGNASLVTRVESTEISLNDERYDLEVANIKIKEQEEYLNNMDTETSELRTELSEQISLMQNGLQEKDITICEMEKRLEEKEKDVERNGLEVSKQRESTDKMLANTGVRETELVEELSSMQEELKNKSNLVGKLEKLVEESQKQQSTIAAAGDSCAEDASKLRVDVDRLTTSNKAAQEWMANASEHSKRSNQNLARAKKEVVVLTKQLDEKKEEITTLNTTVGSLRSSASIAKEGTMNALKLEQQVNELIQINEKLNKEKNDSVERTSDLAEAESFELRSEVSKVQAQLAEEVTNNASLVIKAESTEAVLKTERYDLEVAKIKIEEQEEYLKKMDIEASELRESSDCYIVETKLKETQLSEQISLIEKGLQEKDVTICEMEKRLEEKEKDVERNGLELYKQLNLTKKEVVALRGKLDERDEEAATHKTTLQSFRTSTLSKVNDLENKVNILCTERDECVSKLVQMEKQLEDKKKELSLIMKGKEEDLESMKLNTSKQQKVLEQSLTNAEDRVVDLSKKLSLIQQELNSKDSTIREKEEEVIELKRNSSMKGSRSDSDAKEISKLQTEIQTLNLKLMDLVEEVQIAKDKYFELENSSKAQLAKLVVEDTSRLNEENEKKSEEIVLLSNKLMFSQKKSNSLAKDHRENLAFFANLQKETDSLTKEKEILTITCADHNAAIKNLHKELADFQTRSDTEKKRMLELIAIKSVVEEKLQVIENVKQLSEEKDDEIEKLQGQITNLEVQSNELNRKIRIIVKKNKDLESTNSKQRGNLEKIDENLFEKENEIIRIETEFKLTRNELEELNIESEDVILKWQERVSELESSMNEQEVKLGKQQEDASNAILQWESRCKLLEERLIDETKHLNDNVGELSEVLKLKDSSLHNLEEQIKINIAEVLRLNNEHITHVQQMQEILDERDEHVKELLAAGEQSEKVVLQWQDNSQQLEVTVN